MTGPCGGFVGSRGDLDLVLSEEKALPVEYSDSLAGATLLAGGRIAYWSRDGRLTLVDSLGQRTQAQLPAGSRVVAVLSEENGSALVIDGHQRRGLQLSHDGRVITERRLPVSLGQGEAIIDGAHYGRRLVLGVADTMYGRFRVVAADEPENALFMGRYQPADPGVPFRLSQMETSLLVTQSSAPHLITWVHTNGTARPFGTPSVDSTAGRPVNGTPEHAWVSVATIALDGGVLQMLSDLADDARRLVRYDRRGRVVTTTALGIPFGVTAADVQSKRLLGVRRVGSLELVVYTWAWQRHGAPTTNVRSGSTKKGRHQ